jgi:hypothetical protein
MRYLLILVAMLIFSCKEQQKKHMRMPVRHSQEKCDADFDVFFEKFKRDSVFQKKHVKFPLKNTFLNSEGMYEVVREDITLEKYHFLDFTKDKESEREPGGFKVYLKSEKDTMFYSYRGVDNGINGDIKFVFINDCWCLVAIEDSST